MSGQTLKIETPLAFEGLFAPKRYKVFYGGRGGAKSYAFADALIVQGLEKPTRILCAREIQKSIKDSVHKLISDRIKEYGLDGFYTITNDSIKGANGSEFIFKGLKHNTREIKSTEGIDRCWVEEAENVSDASWELLIPTIRKPGSEIWISFNPKNPTDPTYIRFVQNADDNVLCRKVGWRENPWFPEVLDIERRKLEREDPEAYKHVWEGDFDTRYFGGVYAKWVAKMYEDGRARDGLYDSSLPVYTAWDLGWSDSTAIWFWQQAGQETRIIDCYENSNEDVEHYCCAVKSKPYKYAGHFVPHDAANKLLAAGGKSIVEQARTHQVDMVVIPATAQANSIEALRLVLKTAYIDKTACKDGIHALQQYQFEYDEDLKTYKKTPIHDWSSHYADAAEIMARVIREERVKKPIAKKGIFCYEGTPDGKIVGTIDLKAYLKQKARERRDD